MQIISRRNHGFIDYALGLLIMTSPKLFGHNLDGPEAWVPFGFGAAVIGYSLLTDYEVGVFRTLSFRTHLTLDVLSGMALAVSPWLFEFAHYVWMPHMLLGLAEIGAVLITRTDGVEHRTGAPGTPAHS